ncbi:MAG: GNVR domain-containing protein [Blastomonas sp.]
MNGLYDEFMIAVHSVWQRRWMALAIAWAICILGWLAVALVPNSYESQARVFVQMQSILPDKIGITPNDRKRQIDRIEQTLVSASNLEKVVRATDLGKTIASPRELEGAVSGLRQSIKVTSERENLFQIVATASAGGRSDAEAAKLSRDIVQKLIDIFVEENLADGRGETSDTLRFLDAQLEQRQKELEAAEQKRVQFETENLGLLPGVGSISERMATARQELNQIDSQLISAQSALAAINGQLAGTPSTISVPGGGGGARGQLAQVQGQLAAARARGQTDQHPDVIALKNQISQLQAQARNEPSGSYGTPNPAYSSLQSIRADRQATVAALQARKNAIQADLSTMSAKQTQEPGIAAEQARLNRDYEVLKQQYDKLLSDREEVRLRGQVETETDAIRFELIDPPVAPRAPIAPNRPLLLVLVLFVGIGGGIGAAFAHSQLRSTYPTAARLERASGLPVIGSISQILTSEQRVQRKQKMKLFLGSSGALVAVFLLLLTVEFVQRGSVA